MQTATGRTETGMERLKRCRLQLVEVLGKKVHFQDLRVGSKELLAAVSLLVWHHRLPRPELEGRLQHLLHFY